MDREDISKRCVLFKNVPLQTCQSKFRLWLDHVESCAFRDLYLDVQPHIEDKYDKRWIVLFKQETGITSFLKFTFSQSLERSI